MNTIKTKTLETLPRNVVIKLFNVKIIKLIRFINNFNNDKIISDKDVNMIKTLIDNCEMILMDRFIKDIHPNIVLSDIIQNLNKKKDNVVINVFKKILRGSNETRILAFTKFLNDLNISDKSIIRNSVIELLKISNIFI